MASLAIYLAASGPIIGAMKGRAMLDEDANGGREAEVVRALEEDIIFGRLQPGEKLTEDALLARFPVSRHFVRQAIGQLERIGLVIRERNKTASVRMVTPTEVR